MRCSRLGWTIYDLRFWVQDIRLYVAVVCIQFRSGALVCLKSVTYVSASVCAATHLEFNQRNSTMRGICSERIVDFAESTDLSCLVA